MGDEEASYPAAVAVDGYNQAVVDFLRTTECRTIAELGVYRGDTSMQIASWLNGAGELHLYDFEDTAEGVADRLRSAGFTNVKVFGNSYRYLDSYNWSLAKMLEANAEPVYDLVFIDGAHTWAVDGFATLLVDRLLKPGGYIAHDDYGWTLGASPSLRPQAFPLTRKLYSEEQIEAQQVRMICDLLLRRNSGYEEVVPNTIWRKLSD